MMLERDEHNVARPRRIEPESHTISAVSQTDGEGQAVLRPALPEISGARLHERALPSRTNR